MSHKRIHPLDLFANPPLDVCILDVRTAAEVDAAGLPDSLHIPLHELSVERLQTELARAGKNGEAIYLLCQAGRRAEMAADQLAGKVSAELVVIDGGMNAIVQCKLPHRVRPRKVISLERQVRIAAGSLVLLGAALGALVNPAFYGLSAFVGAGLIFAGVTDICPTAMLIAKAPWNR